jgi:hypothetical protein
LKVITSRYSASIAIYVRMCIPVGIYMQMKSEARGLREASTPPLEVPGPENIDFA